MTSTGGKNRLSLSCDLATWRTCRGTDTCIPVSHHTREQPPTCGVARSCLAPRGISESACSGQPKLQSPGYSQVSLMPRNRGISIRVSESKVLRSRGSLREADAASGHGSLVFPALRALPQRLGRQLQGWLPSSSSLQVTCPRCRLPGGD